MTEELGTRVVRGPDWKWENQDGGEGGVGTVVRLGRKDDDKSPSKAQVVLVQWDCGNKGDYRAGVNGKHDLRILDNSNEGIRHVHVLCDGCGDEPVVGLRWHCLGCPNFDLCSTCYMSDKHNLNHPFECISKPGSKGTPLKGRFGSAKVEAQGMYKGARVVRGPHWNYRDQDGGPDKEGVIIKVAAWDKDDGSRKDAVRVAWDKGQRENIYRVGKMGKVDLKCTMPVAGGSYYRDHLPPLTIDPKKTKSGFTTGDKVYVHVTAERLKELSVDHGGWNDDMLKFIRKVGVVQDFTPSGDVMVEYTERRWRYNPEALTKVPAFKRGDEVLVKSDRSLVEELQQGHGGWNEAMISILGRTGKVLEVDNNGDLVTQIEEDRWLLNPAAVTYVPELTPTTESMASSEASGGNGLDGLLSRLLGGLLHQSGGNSGSSNQLVHACRSNSLSRAQEILDAHPETIDQMDGGHTPLQVACHEGHYDVAKLLLERGASRDAIDTEGYMAMHHAAYGDRAGQTLKLLLDRGLDPNVRNLENGSTPLHLAVKRTNIEAVRLLVQFPGCDVNAQDESGDTPLFEAISDKRNSMVDLLLANPRLSMTVTNGGGFNYLHFACLKGNPYAVEKVLELAGDELNVPKSDGFTALHIAAINNHRDEAVLLFRQPGCVIDARSEKRQTPLHLAATEGYVAMVELLLDHGADANAEDEDGDTALHISLAKESIMNSSRTMPGLSELLQLETGSRDSESYANVSRLLLDYGANVNHFNGRGETPLERCSGSNVEGTIMEIATVGGTRPTKAPRFSAVDRARDAANKVGGDNRESRGSARSENVQQANFTNDLDDHISEQAPTSGGSDQRNDEATGHPLQNSSSNESEEPGNQENTVGGAEGEAGKEPCSSNHDNAVDLKETRSHMVNVQEQSHQETEFVNAMPEASEDIQTNVVLEVTNQEFAARDDQHNESSNVSNGIGNETILEAAHEIPSKDGSAPPESQQSNSCERRVSVEEMSISAEKETAVVADEKQEANLSLKEETKQEVCAGDDQEQRVDQEMTSEPIKTQGNVPPTETQQQERETNGNAEPDVSHCQICEENEADVVFKPCGHNVVCTECSSRMKRCYKCKSPIKARGRRDGQPISAMNDKSMAVRYQMLEGKVRKMEEASVCSICVEKKKNVIFLCGHGTCDKCAPQLRNCPFCQKRIERKVTVF